MLTNNGYDKALGYGFKVGYLGQLSDALQLGLSYQSKIYLAEFDKYAGLFAGAGNFDIPATWTAGLGYIVNDWTFLFDVQEIYYSKVNSIGNHIAPQSLPPAFPDGSGEFIPNPNHVPLGESGASGFGWDDMMIFKFGTEYKGIERWTLRGGFSYGNQPVEETEVMFNILAPGVIQKHATIGFTTQLNEKHAINFAAMHGFSQTVTGPNSFEAPDQQTIELKMHQWEFELGFSF